MKVSTDGTRHSIVRTFEITEDHPIVGLAYATRPKKVRITKGAIEYHYEDGAWAVRSSFNINLIGVVLKQDGTDSKNTHSRHPEQTSYRSDAPFREDFAWVQPIVDLLRPTGTVGLMILNESEVDW